MKEDFYSDWTVEALEHRYKSIIADIDCTESLLEMQYEEARKVYNLILDRGGYDNPQPICS